MKNICAITGKEFEITDDDLKFYEKMGVPLPTLCPEERRRRRMVQENARHLYHRTCDATGKKIISLHSSDKKYPVYEKEYWWSDAWDARDYGQDFDFSRPFFEQWQELHEKVPKMSLLVDGNENSEYVNQSGWDKNCYLCFCTDHSENCLYCQDAYHSHDVCDSLLAYSSELCYEIIASRGCYQCFFLQNCENCSDSWFLKNCIGCSYCFGCINLRNKRYYFNNEKCTKDEYLQKIQSLFLEKESFLSHIKNGFFHFAQQHPHKHMEGVGNEKVTGNIVSYSKNARECFESR